MRDALTRLPQRLRLRFTDEALEQRYRISILPADRKALTVILIVAVVFQAVNFASDHLVVVDQAALAPLRWLRILGAASAIAGGVAIARIRDPARFEVFALVWGVITAGTVVVSFALLPNDYLVHTAWSVMLVLAMYVALPMSLSRQAMVAGIFTVGDAVILSYLKEIERPIIRTDILAAHACAHVIGVVSSWQFTRVRRNQFLAVREAEHAHTQEQRAWSQVNVLQGILPICGHCKRIRSETGDWSRLEVYVHQHSEAQFSHSICPDCEREQYGQYSTPPGAT